jgi:hypothetical protein
MFVDKSLTNDAQLSNKGHDVLLRSCADRFSKDLGKKYINREFRKSAIIIQKRYK